MNKKPRGRPFGTGQNNPRYNPALRSFPDAKADANSLASLEIGTVAPASLVVDGVMANSNGPKNPGNLVDSTSPRNEFDAMAYSLIEKYGREGAFNILSQNLDRNDLRLLLFVPEIDECGGFADFLAENEENLT